MVLREAVLEQCPTCQNYTLLASENECLDYCTATDAPPTP